MREIIVAIEADESMVHFSVVARLILIAVALVVTVAVLKAAGGSYISYGGSNTSSLAIIHIY